MLEILFPELHGSQKFLANVSPSPLAPPHRWKGVGTWIIVFVCLRNFSLDESNITAESERAKADNLIQQIVNVEAENNLLRRRLQSHDSDRERDKKLIQQLREQLTATRAVSHVTSGCIVAVIVSQLNKQSINLFELVCRQSA
jgi:hypothetical protein